MDKISKERFEKYKKFRWRVGILKYATGEILSNWLKDNFPNFQKEMSTIPYLGRSIEVFSVPFEAVVFLSTLPDNSSVEFTPFYRTGKTGSWHIWQVSGRNVDRRANSRRPDNVEVKWGAT